MWYLIIITWLGLVEPSMHEFGQDSKRQCEGKVKTLTELYVKARDANPEFGFIVKCEKRDVKP